MLVENGIVRVGTEIEVAAWKGGHRYQEVPPKLIELGYMEGDPENWREYHTYKCDCAYGCSRVKSGAVLVPKPLVSMQYDASLPRAGAEFIVSPVLLIEGMDEMREIWETVTENAVWRNDLESMRGNPNAAPSIHLHVSAMDPTQHHDGMGFRDEQGRLDILHALSLFGPELLLLSDVEEFRRGLAFRQPWRTADGRNGHHGFVQVKRYAPGSEVYIEWRMFEAAYKDWDYLESAAYLCGALTRSLMNAETLPRLMGAGYHDTPQLVEMEAAIRNNDTAAALALASPRRLGALRDLVETELYDDERGLNVLRRKFEEVERRV